MGHSPLTVEEWQAVLAGDPAGAAAALLDAARGGEPVAALHYGQCLMDGRGVARDPQAAFRWFVEAAQPGLAPAINMVGRCLDQGWGVEEAPGLAASWFAVAADKGDVWGLYNYATALCLGRGVAQDRARALDLFRRAAGMGHAKSQNMIGSFHEDGWSVPVNLDVAAYHYARAAEGGDFRGCFNHARMEIAHGRMDSAHRWLNEAARLGHDRFRAQMAQWLSAREEASLRRFADQMDKIPA
ncbi:tetratricopeptide repeat protein [Novosphingobium sp. KACC 22771]|uniref:tetratricopeptide repeat protein n=1 Tax=Novosphingobium sp. KACC 22771 TaxID=3025670 RepID=UPI002366904B|nr:tetratricopeptide repeat protein [Novosphingobium sp. KACC 22771]WDF73886.1 tetratricopeptide repeat protein [Novosphingobium sp. KACC 22771]